MKKLLTFTAIAIISSISSTNAAPITLEVSFSSGAYKANFEEVARQFETKHADIKIEYQNPIVNSYDELIQKTFRDQIVGNLADVSFQGNLNLTLLAEQGLSVPLDPMIQAESDWEGQGYTPAIASVGEVKGKSYALAYATSVPIVFFNLDLVRRAGGDIGNLPEDWPGIIALAKKIQALGDGVVGGYFDYQSTGNWTFQALITGQGGRMMEDDDRPLAFKGSEGMKALEVLKTFGEETGMVDLSQNQAIQAFSAGTIGILASFSAATGRIEKAAAGKFEVRTGAWPVSAKNGAVPAGGRAVVMFTRDPERQKAAWEFIKFVTGPIGQTILVKAVGAVPNNQIAIREPNLLGTYYEKHPNQRAALKLVPKLTRWYAFPGQNQIKITEVIKDHLRTVLIDHKAPQVVMDAMVADVRALLPKN